MQKKSIRVVVEALVGPLNAEDPNPATRLELGQVMAKKVFDLLDQWSTKDANMIIVKHLTLVPSQKRELESDLHQEDFLKEFESVPDFKLHFEFKTKMQVSQK